MKIFVSFSIVLNPNEKRTNTMYFQLFSTMLRVPPINILLNLIIKQYLNNSYCITIVSETLLDVQFDSSYIIISPKNDTDLFFNQLLEVSENGCSDYIVKMKYPERFMIAFDKVSRLGLIRRGDRKIIILLSDNENNFEEKAFNLLAMKETGFVANVLIIIQNTSDNSDCNDYNLVTHEFVKSEGNKPVFLDNWNCCTMQFLNNAVLFPHDISNLNGKIIKVGCFPYSPYVFLDIDTKVTPTGRDGFDIRVLELFCRWVNCSIEIIREDEDMWGGVNIVNGTGSGILGGVYLDEIDVGITGLFPWYDVSLVTDFSTSYIRTTVYLLTPFPEPIPRWMIPILPLKKYIWLSLACSFLLASIGLALANRLSNEKSRRHVWLPIVGIMLTQSQKLGPSWRKRRITGCLMVASWIIVSAYGAGLAHILTVPMNEHFIDTVEDLIDRNMEWGANHLSWAYSLSESTEPSVQKLVSLFRTYPDKELKKRSFTSDMAFCIEKLPGGSYAINKYLTIEALLELSIMLDELYYEHCVMIFRRASPYVRKLNDLIGSIHSSGLMIAWETQITLKYLNYEEQQEVKLSRTFDVETKEPLKLREVMGVFLIYLVGTTFATLIFCVELINNKIKKN